MSGLKTFFPFLFIILLFSCEISEGYLIEYSIKGSATDARIIYLIIGENIEEVVTLPWEKSFFISKDEIIGLSVFNLSAGEIDVRVFFTGNGDKQLYRRVISDDYVMIKGNINSNL